MLYKNILECIGNTPIVELNRIAADRPVRLFGKCEFMNPGGSVKDRIGAWLIEDAEKRGLLKKGGTIVEATSGNTGIGLGMAAAIKGYRCVFVMPDKMSLEKINTLRAFGAEVVITPSGVEPADPKSHYSIARKIAATVHNGYLTEQYDNLANREAHYQTTGPEIWKDLPQLDVFVAGMGTGGTLCGTGRFLREKNKSIRLICGDPPGSLIREVHEHGKQITPCAPYMVEGIGEDFIPKNFDFSVVDQVLTIEDADSFSMARRLLHEEGLHVGISSGTSVQTALQWLDSTEGKKAIEQAEKSGKKLQILALLPDSGDRYMSKTWNDPWLKQNNIQPKTQLPKVRKLEEAKGDWEIYR